MERVGPILVPSPQISRAICIHTLVAGKSIEKSAKTSPGLAVIKTIMSKTFIFRTDKRTLFMVGEGANLEEAKAKAKASLKKLGSAARLTSHHEINHPS